MSQPWCWGFLCRLGPCEAVEGRIRALLGGVLLVWGHRNHPVPAAGVPPPVQRQVWVDWDGL